jgi:hypothetical protein
MTSRSEKADEFRHEDQRSRRRFREPEPVQHLARLQPAIGLDDILRHVGQNRVGATERDDDELGEENRKVREDVIEAKDQRDRQQRQYPDCKPNPGCPHGRRQRHRDGLR